VELFAKVNHFQYQDELGYTQNPALGQWHSVQVRTGSTKLNSITYQVGRTGAIA
jgi:NAD-dependent DNA ligase